MLILITNTGGRNKTGNIILSLEETQNDSQEKEIVLNQDASGNIQKPSDMLTTLQPELDMVTTNSGNSETSSMKSIIMTGKISKNY